VRGRARDLAAVRENRDVCSQPSILPSCQIRSFWLSGRLLPRRTPQRFNSGRKQAASRSSSNTWSWVASHGYSDSGCFEGHLLRRLWSQLYPDVGKDQELRTLHLDQPTSGFVVSYQMRLGSTIPQAKAYINVKHICPSDVHVPCAITAYYYELGTRSLLVHIRSRCTLSSRSFSGDLLHLSNAYS
jgi:hypothetical protein